MPQDCGTLIIFGFEFDCTPVPPDLVFTPIEDSSVTLRALARLIKTGIECTTVRETTAPPGEEFPPPMEPVETGTGLLVSATARLECSEVTPDRAFERIDQCIQVRRVLAEIGALTVECTPVSLAS